MKGAYIARIDLKAPHLAGVAEKVRAQMDALRLLSAQVDVLHPSGASVMRNDECVLRLGKGTLWRRAIYYFLFYPVALRYVKACDFLYVRYQGSSPLFLWFLRRVKAMRPRCCILIELPSYPYHTEYVTLRQRVFGIVDRVCRRALHRYVDAIVTFSREPDIFGIPTIMTDNGVDVAALPTLPPPPDARSIRLVGLANLSFWHGYDRVIAGMRQYYDAGGATEVTFDIVGTGAELERLRKDAEDSELGDRVRFLGQQRGLALERILRQAHVAISSIGMHRLDVDTSNLKSREFCARGLPFVIGYQDRDFPATLPFVFRVTADETPVPVDALLRFHEGLRTSGQNYASRMREYAERHLTWSAKMQPVLLFVKRYLKAGQ